VLRQLWYKRNVTIIDAKLDEFIGTLAASLVDQLETGRPE
jgi:hypothetical protein